MAFQRASDACAWILEGSVLWAAWLRAPRQVGAVAPSGTRLAAAMAGQVPNGDGLVVELGGGTGSITAGLLCAGLTPNKLVVVERDARLAQRLSSRFPMSRVLCGDAFQLPELLVDHGIHQPIKAVVSSVPLLGMAPSRRAQLILGARRLIRGRGPLVQFTYGMRCPAPAGALQSGNVKAQRIARIWRNLPPASVWRFEPSH